MKRLMIVLALVGATTASLSALPGFEPYYLPNELSLIKAELGDSTLGQMKVADLIPLAQKLDVARQKDGFVMMATGMSFAWPGAGQFASGDIAGGTMQTVLHVGISAATSWWADSVLPSDLRWTNLNVFTASPEKVHSAWASHPLNDYWPAIGALAAGGAVDLVLRAWSAHDAQGKARQAIDEGKVTFEPRFLEGGRMGFGMRW